MAQQAQLYVYKKAVESNVRPHGGAAKFARIYIPAFALALAMPFVLFLTAPSTKNIASMQHIELGSQSIFRPLTASQMARITFPTKSSAYLRTRRQVNLATQPATFIANTAPLNPKTFSGMPRSTPSQWLWAFIFFCCSTALMAVCKLGQLVQQTYRSLSSTLVCDQTEQKHLSIKLSAASHESGDYSARWPNNGNVTTTEDMVHKLSSMACSINNPDACDAVQLEIMYLDALRMYHEGKPAISNAMYDQLKLELTWQGSQFPSFTQAKITFLQLALQYARGKPAMTDEERIVLKSSLQQDGENSDIKAFLEFMKVLKRLVQSKPPLASGVAMQAITGEQVLTKEQTERRTPLTMAEFERRPGDKIILKATQQSELLINESTEEGKGLIDYLRLPPSQYSTNVLKAKSVTRTGEDTFRCELEGLDFFGVEITPVLMATVTVDPEASNSSIDITECYLKGREQIRDDERYIVASQNMVTWRPTDDPYQKVMANTCFVQVGFLRPRWFLLPTNVAQRTGSAIVQAVLNRMTNDFLVTLEKDYQAWARDDPNRKKWVA